VGLPASTSIREVAGDSAEVGRQARRLNGAADAWLPHGPKQKPRATGGAKLGLMLEGLPISSGERQAHHPNPEPHHRLQSHHEGLPGLQCSLGESSGGGRAAEKSPARERG
jgi:hypothetical protein